VNDRVPPERYPWWVKFSLIGAKSRSSQWFWVFASLGAAVLLIVLGFMETGPWRYLLGLAAIWAFIAAGLYYFTIRWMDKHGAWPP
jgi:hypothetical protein